MATLNLIVNKISFPNNGTIPNQILASFYIRPYYPVNGPFTLVASDVLIDIDGTVLSSPPPITSIDPTNEYVIRAVNEVCDFTYDQTISVNPYCPPGYTISGDETYCYYQVVTAATPPSSPENSIAVNQPDYSVWGSLIYDPGFNINGTGTFTQIPYSNTFWLNGTGGFPTGTGANTSLGPLNRSGLWSTSALANQTIGFSVCINAPVTGTYYVGIGSDNFASIFLDGVEVLSMDAAAMGAYLSAHGYAGVGVESTFRFWHIYPIVIPAGTHVLELIGNNVTSVASLGAEVYENTSADLIAATSYGMLNLLFSTMNYIGQPIQEGNMNIGYSCPAGYALSLCGSPIVCVKTVTTPILY